jgi:hypothetical protein
VFDAESNDTDLTLAVPILVLVIDAVEVKLIDALGTQCKSTVDRVLIGQEP